MTSLSHAIIISSPHSWSELFLAITFQLLPFKIARNIIIFELSIYVVGIPRTTNFYVNHLPGKLDKITISSYGSDDDSHWLRDCAWRQRGPGKVRSGSECRNCGSYWSTTPPPPFNNWCHAQREPLNLTRYPTYNNMLQCPLQMNIVNPYAIAAYCIATSYP